MTNNTPLPYRIRLRDDIGMFGKGTLGTVVEVDEDGLLFVKLDVEAEGRLLLDARDVLDLSEGEPDTRQAYGDKIVSALSLAVGDWFHGWSSRGATWRVVYADGQSVKATSDLGAVRSWTVAELDAKRVYLSRRAA